MTCERRRELNLHRREASCLQGDVITGYKYLQGNNGDRGGELFTGARWQDTEQARLGRGQPAPRGRPEPGPAAGHGGAPECWEPAAPWQACEGPGTRQQPRLHPSLARRSPGVPPVRSRRPVRVCLGTRPPERLLEGGGRPGWGCPCRTGVGGQGQQPPAWPWLCKRGLQKGDVPCPLRRGHLTASPASLGGFPPSTSPPHLRETLAGVGPGGTAAAQRKARFL